MHVLVVASQKGGGGKSTISAHLGVLAAAAGIGPVCLIDTDPQGTLRQWWNQRAADTPLLAEASPATIGAKLAELRQAGAGLAIVDTPPAVTAAIAAIVEHADLVLIPVRPSPADLWAVGATVQLASTQGRKHAFVLTQATRGASITTQALTVLSQAGPVAGVVHHRVSVAGVLTDGRTVMEHEARGAAAKEMADVWSFVLAQLQGSTDAGKRAGTQARKPAGKVARKHALGTGE